MNLWERIFGKKSSPVQRVSFNPPLAVPRPSTVAPAPPLPVAKTNVTSPQDAITDALAKIEARLLSKRDPLLPIVRVRLQETALGKQIVWCYRTSYDGPEMTAEGTKAAEALLNQELKSVGLTVSDGGYMGGSRKKGTEGEGNQIFNYEPLMEAPKLPESSPVTNLSAERSMPVKTGIDDPATFFLQTGSMPSDFPSLYPPFDENLYRFASAVAEMCYSILGRKEKKAVYDNMLFTPAQLVWFYQHYEENLAACSYTESHNLSSDIFAVEFFAKKDLLAETKSPRCLRFYGLFTYIGGDTLHRLLNESFYDQRELGLQGMYQSNFHGRQEDYSSIAGVKSGQIEVLTSAQLVQVLDKRNPSLKLAR